VGQTFPRLLLLAFSGVLLLTGGTLLWRQASQLVAVDERADYPRFEISHDAAITPIQGAFPVNSAKQLRFLHNEKSIFEFTAVNYRDRNTQARTALLFPKNPQDSVLMPSPTGQRHAIWQEAATMVSEKSPQDALFLGWWDDSQRLHFLSGRETWLTTPGAATFKSPLWQNLQSVFTPASNEEEGKLKNLARWLTMDSRQALAEMAAYFGKNRPVYLAVTNDLLMRSAEMADYGGSPLSIPATTLPVSANLHGDIRQIQTMAGEMGDGNYLVQKEGASYRIWVIPKNSPAADTLLIRLLPFVNSLKHLPESARLVYQSHWGAYFSVYRLVF
jgi:hydroxylamine oxidation protein HaoB